MKKNIFILILIASVLSGVTCCKRGRNTAIDKNKITVTTTVFAPYDFVRNIAGNKVNLFMLLPPGAETHSFEPSPRDIITMMESNIFIYVGGSSDSWVKRMLEPLNKDNMKILAMMDAVEVVWEETVEGMQHGGHDDDHDDHDHHDDHDDHKHGHYDEHVWTSPKNAILIVRYITESLCEADPKNEGFYRKNAASYITELEKVDASFREIVSGAKRKTIVFGDRFPFRYFSDAYGLEYFAAFPGCSTETEPSAATVAFLINKIKNEKIPVVFHIELSNERMADTISAETGAKKLLFHASHNVSKKDFDSGLGYLEIMRRNALNLREALH